MNNLRIVLLIVLIHALVVSCNKKPCEKVQCANSGVLVFEDKKCSCECPSSATGKNCEISLIDSLNGYFSLFDSCSGATSSRFFDQDSSNKKRFTLRDLGNFSCSAGSYDIALKIDTTYVKIDSQRICSVAGLYDGYLIWGAGRVDYNSWKINLTYYASYSVSGSNIKDTCFIRLFK